jgi:hypothetical protein
MAQLEYTIKLRSNTSTEWTTTNPTLALGEVGLESNTMKAKIGDGITSWNDLGYNILTAALFGQPNGVLQLNSSGEIDPEFINQVATAATTSFTPSGNIIASNVQAAIQELDNEKEPSIAASTTDTFYNGDKTFKQVTTDNTYYEVAKQIGDVSTHDDLQDSIEHIWSAGVMEGCEITDNLDGTIDIAAGFAVLRSSADQHADLYLVAVPAQAGLALLDNSANWVYLDYNAGVPQFSTSASSTAFNGMDKCITYLIYRSGTSLNTINAVGLNVDSGNKTRKLFLDFNRFIHASGGSVLGSPSTTTVSLTAGEFYFVTKELPHDAFDTSVAGTANANVFTLWYRDGVGSWTSVADQKTITTTTYDSNAGTPTTLDNNKYGVTWFYLVHDSPSKLHAVMGQAQYADLASANAATPPSTVPGLLSETGSILGSVVYLKSAVTFANILSAFTQSYSSSAATSHNGLSGIQGGTINEYYHLTSSEQSRLVATLAATPSTSVATPSTHKVPIVLNGTTYYLLLSNV